MQAVDEMVEDIVGRLEKAGELDNTYIFYTGVLSLKFVEIYLIICSTPQLTMVMLLDPIVVK